MRHLELGFSRGWREVTACATVLILSEILGAETDWRQALEEARQAEQSQNLPHAESLYERVVKIQPSAEVYQRLGLVRHLQNKFQQADAAFEEALRLNPRLWPAHLFAGIDLYRTNRFSEALAHLRAADQLQANQKETRYWLGATLLALHEDLDGLEFLEKVLADEPGNVDALSLLARAYADYGTRLLDDVAERYPDSAAGLLVQGQAYEFEGSFDAALECYLKAEAKDPKNSEARTAIVRLQASHPSAQ